VAASRKSKKKAGHRSWAAGNAPVPGKHSGDIMSREKRSSVMSRIRSKDTGPEKVIVEALLEHGLEFEQHAADLPGKPDVLFRETGVAVFIDGDFWHGWRFPLWQHKLTSKWQAKIAGNRRRDQRNMRKLRRDGWRVIRIWEHQVEQNLEKCISRILSAVHL